MLDEKLGEGVRLVDRGDVTAVFEQVPAEAAGDRLEPAGGGRTDHATADGEDGRRQPLVPRPVPDPFRGGRHRAVAVVFGGCDDLMLPRAHRDQDQPEPPHRRRERGTRTSRWTGRCTCSTPGATTRRTTRPARSAYTSPCRRRIPSWADRTPVTAVARRTPVVTGPGIPARAAQRLPSPRTADSAVSAAKRKSRNAAASGNASTRGVPAPRRHWKRNAPTWWW